MPAAQFMVTYDGPAVSEENAIDAAVLGGSLVALADLLRQAQSIIDQDPAEYRLRVTATGGGSFEVTLELVNM